MDFYLQNNNSIRGIWYTVIYEVMVRQHFPGYAHGCFTRAADSGERDAEFGRRRLSMVRSIDAVEWSTNNRGSETSTGKVMRKNRKEREKKKEKNLAHFHIIYINIYMHVEVTVKFRRKSLN